MFNLIRADLYKVYKRAYSKVFIGVCSGLVLFYSVMMSIVQSNLAGWEAVPTRSEMLLVYGVLLAAGMYMAIITTDMVFSEEYKHGTLKNTVAFGYTRGQIYFAKLIAASIVMIVLALILAVVCVVTSWIFFKPDDMALPYTRYFLMYVLIMIPLYLSQVAISVAVWFNIKNATFGSVLVVCYTALLPSIFEMIAAITEKTVFCKIANIFPIRQLYKFREITDFSQVSTLAGDYFINGMSFFIIFAVLGWLFFRRKEIK